MSEIYGSDAYSPKEIAERVETIGVAKAQLPFVQTFALGILAGGFIGLGAMFYTVVASDPTLGFAVSRVLGGLVFSLGLILVVVAGAELFTGNNLMVMACVSRRITLRALLRNFAIVYVANFVGAVGLAVLVFYSGHASSGTPIAARAVAIAETKMNLPLIEAFLKGVLCNILVCLAVWIALAGRSVVDKIAAIVFPVTAFVAAGFEHCVANMYLIPLGILLKGGDFGTNLGGLAHNLLPVTLGNLVGGAGMVGLVYFLIYHRKK
jgi:formate transporter